MGLLMVVSACSDSQESPQEAPQPVVLKGEIFTFGSEMPVLWSGGQAVGVYMLKSGQDEVAGEYANVKYLADNRGTTGYLVPADNVPIYLPQDGSKVDFRVYYPYDAQVVTRGSSAIHATQVSIDSHTSPDAFLYSNNSQGVDKAHSQTTIQIKSMLSVIQIDFHCDVDGAASLSASINGMATEASFDLINGVFTQRVTKPDGTLTMQGTRSEENGQMLFTMSATILSGEVETNAALQVTLKDSSGQVIKEYNPIDVTKVMELDEEEKAEENSRYEVEAQLGESEEITTQLKAKTSIFILNWTGNDEDAENGVARPQ